MIGRAVKALLLLRLDQGERLRVLDSLAGGASLVSTLMTSIELRALTAATLALLLIWSFSPLGSQSVLRVIATSVLSHNTTETYNYMNVSGYPPWLFDYRRQGAASITMTLFTASLISSWNSKRLPTDPWGNVKVPFLEPIEQHGDNKSGWYEVGQRVSEQAEYASLIGIPIASIADGQYSKDFTFETSYWWLDCPQIGNVAQPAESDLSWMSITGSTGFTLSTLGRPLVNDTARPFVITTRAGNMTARPEVLFGAMCFMRTTYVEARVHCNKSSCCTSALRRSRLTHPSETWTVFDVGDNEILEFFALQLGASFLAATSDYPGLPTMFHYYLADPSASVVGVPDNDTYYEVALKVANITAEDFAIRFGQLLNTYWVAMVGYLTISNGAAELTADSTPWTTQAYAADSGEPYLNATGTRTKQFEAIQCHYAWLASLLTASFLLFCTSFMPTAVHLVKRTPDISLNISSMVRDNPRVEKPLGRASNSTLDASDQARMWKNIKVQFGDVMPQDQIGHLAIGSLGNGKSMAKAKGDRLYD